MTKSTGPVRRIVMRMTPEREAQHVTEALLLSERGKKIAKLLYLACGHKGTEPSPLTISQATELLRNHGMASDLKALL